MKPEFTRLLIEWNKRQNDREMPWKGEKNPYKIWISEIILQQTRVEQGWTYYEKFIKVFPTIHDLANAPDEKVFKLWEGLGYYSRCKNLLASARIIVKEYKAVFPRNYEEIIKLKGIGPYTAAAISSFAFNEPYAVVDGNVQRIIARYFGITTSVNTTAGKRLFEQLAQTLLDKEMPAIYNQAIMDFGAVICKPQNPLCTRCVQRKECMAYKLDVVKTIPVKDKSIVKRDRWFYYYLFAVGNKLYVRKRTQKDIWQNLYEFVLQETKSPVSYSPGNKGIIKKLIGKQSFTIVSVSKIYRQQLSHQFINGQFIVVTVNTELPGLKEYTLMGEKKLRKLAFPALINKYLHSQPDSLTFQHG